VPNTPLSHLSTGNLFFFIWLGLPNVEFAPNALVLPPAQLEPNKLLSQAVILGVWGGSHMSGS